ncbi:MAG: isoprenylcysteine carboxylmethyltransferase family protein [Velocimicrobium sp.]
MYFFGNTYFQGSLLKNVFQIVFMAVIITELAILIFTTWNNHKNLEKKTMSDRGSMLFIIIGFWLAILINPICVNMTTFMLPVYLFWIGVILTILGILTRVYSVWTLRNFFTLNVQVATVQNIVKTGPYKYIRHPAYTGSIITLSGIAVSFRSLLGIIATVIIISVVYGYRIKVEEKALETSFGSSYEDYERHTWKLFPHIW